MPRTKAPRKKKQENKIATLITKWSETKLAEVNKAHQIFLEKLEAHNKEAKLAIPIEIAMKTAREMIMPELSSTASFANNSTRPYMDPNRSTAKHNSKMQSSVLQKSRVPVKQDLSSIDEGYLTGESSNSATTGNRKSRPRERQQKIVQVSRSLTRDLASKRDTKVINNFGTPYNRHPPAMYGIVTPKVAPNTPQVVLRRPIMGEMVLSLQGSPIFTGNVNSENAANINVPLEDGKLLSIQPQRGLRLSQIPELNPEVKRQLEVLRDNLNKFCSKR